MLHIGVHKYQMSKIVTKSYQHLEKNTLQKKCVSFLHLAWFRIQSVWSEYCDMNWGLSVIIIFYNFVCMCFVYMYSAHHVHTWCLQKEKRVLDPGTGVRNRCELPGGFCELNLSLLGERVSILNDWAISQDQNNGVLRKSYLCSLRCKMT